MTVFYETPLGLLRVLIDMYGWSPIEGTETVSLPGYLFDMNRFFQMVLLRFLRENLLGLQIESERGFGGVLSYTLNPLRRKDPAPKPDFVVRRATKIVAVLDAKYRDLWVRDPPPREWIYQLAMYASGLGPQSSAVILYATQSELAHEERIELRSVAEQNRIAEIILRPVKINRIASALADRGGTSIRARKEWARELVFGAGGNSSIG
jgi:5-methylcytosine-specific restriction enzyme subunit McrC